MLLLGSALIVLAGVHANLEAVIDTVEGYPLSPSTTESSLSNDGSSEITEHAIKEQVENFEKFIELKGYEPVLVDAFYADVFTFQILGDQPATDKNRFKAYFKYFCTNIERMTHDIERIVPVLNSEPAVREIGTFVISYTDEKSNVSGRYFRDWKKTESGLKIVYETILLDKDALTEYLAFYNTIKDLAGVHTAREIRQQ